MIAKAFDVSSTKLAAIPLPVPLAVKEIVEPPMLTAPVVLPIVVIEPEVEAKVVFPDEAKVVKLAVEGVVAPISGGS